MKKYFTLIVFLFLSALIYPQSSGDVCIIGANTYTSDQILFITFVDIPANTNIYFTDNSWNGTSWDVGSSSVEGWWTYTTPAEGLTAGDVIEIDNMGSYLLANKGSAVMDNTYLLNFFGNNGSTPFGDQLYMYLGNDKDTPTTFLFAISTDGPWATSELQNTNLTDGVNAIYFQQGQEDNLEYQGIRTGTISDIKSAIADNSTNWSSTLGGTYYSFNESVFNISGVTQRPNNITVSNITSTKMEVTWTKPLGVYGTDWDGVVVFISQGAVNNGSISTTDGIDYNGNLNFGSGTSFGNGYTVVNQTTDADGDITITGLTENQTYYLIAYTYKTVSGTGNDVWSNASGEISDQAEVQGVTDFYGSPGTSQVDLVWTNYTGAVATWWDEVMIVAKDGSEVDCTPLGDGSSYTANTTFGSGTEIGTGNFVVYKGTGGSVTATSLTNSSTYYFKAYVRYGTDWTDADQYKTANATPVMTIDDPSAGELIISEVNDVLMSGASYFELYNNTSSTIDLSSVTVEYYMLGHSSADYIKTLSGFLASNEYVTIAASTSDFNLKFHKDPDFVLTNFFAGSSSRDGIAVRTTLHGIIDRFNDVPSATVSRVADHLYERVSYPNDGSDLANHWSDIGSNNGTPGTANTSPLPVELTTFLAKLNDNKVELNWETSTEVNNYGFQIERKVNNIWAKIGFIAGSGNSNSVKEYSFIDNTITSSGKYNYRLKQIDIDGGFKYSETIEINIVAPEKFVINQNYPNPFNPSTEIKYEIPRKENVSIKVYNSIGKEVQTLVNENQDAGIYKVKFNGQNLSSGIYFYQIEAGKYIVTKKMILLK